LDFPAIRDQEENLGGLTFNRNISGGYKKAKGPSLSALGNPAGRDALNQFLLFYLATHQSAPAEIRIDHKLILFLTI
jgi:hypothetical protein